MRKKDYVGRHARTKRRIETVGGDVLPKGSVVEITRTYRGKFSIQTTIEVPHGQGIANVGNFICRGVWEGDLELLPEDPQKLAGLLLKGAIDAARGMGFVYKIDRGERTLSSTNRLGGQVMNVGDKVTLNAKAKKLPATVKFKPGDKGVVEEIVGALYVRVSVKKKGTVRVPKGWLDRE